MPAGKFCAPHFNVNKDSQDLIINKNNTHLPSFNASGTSSGYCRPNSQIYLAVARIGCRASPTRFGCDPTTRYQLKFGCLTNEINPPRLSPTSTWGFFFHFFINKCINLGYPCNHMVQIILWCRNNSRLLLR